MRIRRYEITRSCQRSTGVPAPGSGSSAALGTDDSVARSTLTGRTVDAMVAIKGQQALQAHSERSRRVLEAVLRVGQGELPGPVGSDLVHVDLTASNVLFDENDRATGVVDWNLGAYRGDRHFALVQTRLDREWFVQSPDADPVENAAAAHLDEIPLDRIAPATLRLYWSYWMLHQLSRAIRSASAEVVEWHLDMAESRLA